VRILVLGGTGFVGSYLVRQLSAGGHQVAVFHRGQKPPDLPAGVDVLTGDRDRLPEHAAELRQWAPRVVVHQIAYVEAHALHLLEVFRGVAERTVVVSSGDVYRSYGVFHGTESDPLEPVPATEDAPLRTAFFPYRPFAKSPDDFVYSYDKIPVERAAQSDPALPATVLRLPMVYGPGDPQRRLSGYLRRVSDGRPRIPLDETLALWRCSRGYVEDVAAAIALAATDGRSAGRTYNVGEPAPRTEGEWVRMIGAAAGWGGKVVAVPHGPLPVPGNFRQNLTTDTTRIRGELGYRETVPPDEALARGVRWEREQPPVAAIDYAAEDAALAALDKRPAIS
jgi:nucleoside-diphosphate-sugar epimerase